MHKKVMSLLEAALAENPSLFLIDLDISSTNHIKVIIDGDEGVKVEDCILVSRAIEGELDREEEDFSLEVLSAGVSEPLKLVRQYKKNLGRSLKVKTAEETFEGSLTNVDETAITLKWKAREPKPIGKGKITVEKKAEVPYTNIVEAKVMITF
jgi:ribosome maturation factor RimP